MSFGPSDRRQRYRPADEDAASAREWTAYSPRYSSTPGPAVGTPVIEVSGAVEDRVEQVWLPLLRGNGQRTHPGDGRRSPSAHVPGHRERPFECAPLPGVHFVRRAR